ncbi:MAG: hypothetical protein ACM31J_06480 [Nitrososphaerales archaeon]
MNKDNFCKIHNTAYRNGKTFEECKQVAVSVTEHLSKEIETKQEISWAKVLEYVDHDELIYKLTLKYLRQKGYDIGNNKTPIIKKSK